MQLNTNRREVAVSSSRKEMQLNTNRREVAVSSSRKEMQLNRIRRGAHELQVGKFKRRKGMIKQILKKHFCLRD